MTAAEILELLKKSELGDGITGQQALMSWGACNFVGSTSGDDSHWLKFKVHGNNYQGDIRITLRGDGLFRVDFEKFNHKAGNKYNQKTLDLVYAAKLLVKIDTVVEGNGLQEE
jgi:hypothetical protein